MPVLHNCSSHGCTPRGCRCLATQPRCLATMPQCCDQGFYKNLSSPWLCGCHTKTDSHDESHTLMVGVTIPTGRIWVALAAKGATLAQFAVPFVARHADHWSLSAVFGGLVVVQLDSNAAAGPGPTTVVARLRTSHTVTDAVAVLRSHRYSPLSRSGPWRPARLPLGSLVRSDLLSLNGRKKKRTSSRT